MQQLQKLNIFASLSEKLNREGLLPLDESLRIFRETLKGLHYLHNRKRVLVFNNITPQNIIIKNDGTVKLMNLGHLSILKIPHKPAFRQ